MAGLLPFAMGGECMRPAEDVSLESLSSGEAEPPSACGDAVERMDDTAAGGADELAVQEAAGRWPEFMLVAWDVSSLVWLFDRGREFGEPNEVGCEG